MSYEDNISYEQFYDMRHNYMNVRWSEFVVSEDHMSYEG